MPDRGWLIYSNIPNFNSYKTYGLQREKIRIPRFDYQESFNIGILANRIARDEFPDESVVIDISLPNGHCLFRMVTNAESSLEDDDWIKRNRETAIGYGYSSFFMGLKINEKLPRYEKNDNRVDYREYEAFDGGALPIFAGSCGVPVACLSVSGLENYENHWVAVESVRDHVIKVNGFAGKYTPTGEHAVDCGICMSEVQTDGEYYVTPCNHIFHSQCLKTWRYNNNNSRPYNKRKFPDCPKCPVCWSPAP